MIVRYQATTLMKFQVLPISFRFAAMCVKNVLLPTPAISQTSAAVLSELSYKILAFSNFAGSVLGLPPVLVLRNDSYFRKSIDKFPCACQAIIMMKTLGNFVYLVEVKKEK